jgi:hypothetical protein
MKIPKNVDSWVITSGMLKNMSHDSCLLLAEYLHQFLDALESGELENSGFWTNWGKTRSRTSLSISEQKKSTEELVDSGIISTIADKKSKQQLVTINFGKVNPMIADSTFHYTIHKSMLDMGLPADAAILLKEYIRQYKKHLIENNIDEDGDNLPTISSDDDDSFTLNVKELKAKGWW